MSITPNANLNEKELGAAEPMPAARHDRKTRTMGVLLGLLFAAHEGLNIAGMRTLADEADSGRAVAP